MKYSKILPGLLTLIAAAVLFTACKKIVTPEPLEDAGQTIVKLISGGTTASPGYKIINIDLKSTPQTVAMADIRRDIPNNMELNKQMSVTIKDDPGAVIAYDTNLVPLPAGSYTINAATPRIGTDYTINLAPGQFAQQIEFTLLNALSLDLNNRYAFGFTISSITGDGKIAAEEKTIVVEIGVKNKYDGIYEVSGTMVDITNPALVHVNIGLAAGGYDPQQMELRTISATKCALFDPVVYGDFASPIWTGTAFSGYGLFSIIVEFDEVTNKVIAVTNYAGQPAANTRYGRLDPSGLNYYDPGTKTVFIKYNMAHPSVVTAPPFIRSTWTETWKFVKAR